MDNISFYINPELYKHVRDSEDQKYDHVNALFDHYHHVGEHTGRMVSPPGVKAALKKMYEIKKRMKDPEHETEYADMGELLTEDDIHPNDEDNVLG